MKFQFYIVAFLSIAILGSCKKNFLQRDPGVPIDYEQLFSDPQLAAGFGDNSYNFLLDDYARLSTQNGMTGQFSDESISNTGDQVVNLINTGRHLNAGATDVTNVYGQMYRGIRNTNVMLLNIGRVPWTSTHNPGFIRGEQLFLRGFFYFELMKRFGGVVLLEKPQTVPESGQDLPRTTYAETLAFILKDLNEAASLLPEDWTGAHYGRATKGAAMALKARTLLHAASPLHNSSGDAAKWRMAADAAKAVMDMNKYSLEPNYGDVLVQATSPEYIMIDIKTPRGWVGYINNFIAPTSYGGAQSLISPTQNHVDLYEMSNGKLISDPTSGYNPQQPYLNRDPRFYNNIIYNDQTWQGRKVQTFIGGTDYSATSNIFTKTSYYLKRLWPEQVRNTGGGTGLVNFIFFRYAEVLLNYAEALNEADGPTTAVHNAVNAVRMRAGLPALPTNLSKDAMRDRIRNERAVEFAFEEMRWWDILRWKKGPELVLQPMRGMQITRSGTTFTYTPVVLAANYQKVFEEYMHLYPIPAAEIYKSPGALKQNPGW